MPPISMLIKPVSGLCNMRCKYCFYNDVVNHRDIKNYGVMSEITLENIVKKSLESAEYSVSFAFQGGEPTLAGLDFYNKLIDLQKMYNRKKLTIYNSIQTNGYNVSEDMVKFLANNNFLVGISLDGYKDTHDFMRIDKNGNGTYCKIIKTIELFKKYNVQFNILCVVNGIIAKHPQKIFNALKKYRYIQFIPCIDGFEGDKSQFSLNEKDYTKFLCQTFELYYNEFKNGNYVSVRNFDNYIGILLGKRPENCAMAGKCNCYHLIEADGSTFPCDFYVLDKWKLGNINYDDINELINNNISEEFTTISENINEKCKDCKWFFLCRGGCRRDRDIYGDGKIYLNKYCNSYIEFFNHTYSKMKEIAFMVSNKKV